jgi:hypothetical protein
MHNLSALILCLFIFGLPYNVHAESSKGIKSIKAKVVDVNVPSELLEQLEDSSGTHKDTKEERNKDG